MRHRTDRTTAGLWARLERLQVALSAASAEANYARNGGDVWARAAAERDRLQDERDDMADAIDAAREQAQWETVGARN